MCGRFVITSAPEALRRLFGYPEQPNFPPRFNIAPTQPIPVVTCERDGPHFRLMRWGFIPAFAKEPRKGAPLINARAEGIVERPAFRNAIRRRRCLIPADGYYEWQMRAGRKQPFFIRAHDGQPFAFAGVWETWSGPHGEELDTVAIITAQASDDLAAIHSRVPVTIAHADYAQWLAVDELETDAALKLLAPPLPGSFTWHAVSPAVGRVANDDPSLIAPLSEDEVEIAAVEAAVATPEPSPRGRAKAPRRDDGDSGQGELF